MQHWLPDYQTRDFDIVDYQEFTLPGCEVRFRGPGLNPFATDRGAFFTCLGAAQTYGCFYDPYPKLLAARIGMPALNLAVGGASSGFYLQYPSLIDAARRSKFVVLQATAARQESNSRFAAHGHAEFVKDMLTGEAVPSAVAWEYLVREEFDALPEYVSETRQSWIEATCQLIEAIGVPVVFFWYSHRQPDYEINWSKLRELRDQMAPGGNPAVVMNELWSDHPHMVDGPSARAAAAVCSAEARCVSSRGMGAVLVSRHTGQPIEGATYKERGMEYRPLVSGRNHYYPSAEMHEDAAAALEPVVRNLLGDQP
jgi:hypothetical protein